MLKPCPLTGVPITACLNCTSKFAAALAACMTILSYIATAVISSKTAVDYVYSLYPHFSVTQGTLLVLAVFATLDIIGITESAIVALCIFIFHMGTLAMFIIIGFFSIPGVSIFVENLKTLPTGNGLLISIALGFSAALLGISGFESSANFVEEQDVGVFRKTLRNMLVAVGVINPLTSILSLCMLPVATIIVFKDYLLSEMAYMMGGQGFKIIVVLDAAAVLSGAVLTSFVGVTGLVQRMALDQCLPQFLLKKNSRATCHRIIIAFFLLCSSILIVTKGELLSLAGVYTISFLGVMTLFGMGDILLKVRRKELKRTYRAPWSVILIAICATSFGMIGNVIIDYMHLVFFLQYFIPTIIIVLLMYLRIPILKTVLELLNNLMSSILVWRTRVIDSITDITDQRVILFTRAVGLERLHAAFSYIVKNESSRSVVVIHLFSDPKYNEEDSLKKSLETIGEIFSTLKLQLIVREGRFGPEIIDEVSREYGVVTNNIFIGAPEEKHSFSVQDLGGVRVIF